MKIDFFSAITLLLGGLLGLGIFLLLSLKLWPRHHAHVIPRARGSLSLRLSTAAVQLGMPESVFLALQVVIAVVSGLLGFAATGITALSVVAGLAGGSLLWLIAAARQRASAHSLRLLWPDVVDALVSAIRSGSNIPESLMSLAAHHEPRISKPAAEFAQDYRLTSNIEMSLDRLKMRWASAPADRIVETLRLAREVGSSETTNVLMALGSHLRSESAVRQELEARQGWIKVAARIGLVAPWVVLVLLATRAEAAAAYNTPAGLLVIALGGVLSMVAYQVMAGIGRLRTEQRWMS